MGILDAAIGEAFGAFGKKPSVPQYANVDTTAEQGQAIAGNESNLDMATRLASQTNASNQSDILAQLRKAIPNYDDIVAKVTGNIGNMVSGKLPTDVSDLVNRSTAARAVGGGYGGTGLANNLTARDLGTTSLALTEQGNDAASRWISQQKQTATAPNFDVSSMFVSPAQRIAQANTNNSNQFQQQWLQNQISAMPSPEAVAWSKGVSSETDSIVGALGSAVGGASGGGGGGGGGSL